MFFKRKRAVAAAILLVFCCSFTNVQAAESSKKYGYENAVRDFYDALEYIDRIYYFNDEVDYNKIADAAIKAAYEQLDPWSTYMTLEEYDTFQGSADKIGIGVNVRLMPHEGRALVIEVFDNTPAKAAGILQGDSIYEIDGIPLEGKDLTEIRNLLAGAEGDTVKLSFVRKGEDKSLSIKREKFVIPLVSLQDISGKLEGADNKNTALIKISSFWEDKGDTSNDTASQLSAVMEKLRKTGPRNLIIDLRNNTGGDVSALNDTAKVFARKGLMYTFKYNDGSSVVVKNDQNGTEYNIAVLVNENTASSAEVLASVIKESGAGILVGSETYGKGVGQIIMEIGDGSHLVKLTIAEIISKNGNKINGVGVIPDIYIDPPTEVSAWSTIDKNSDREEINLLRKSLKYLGYDIKTDVYSFDTQLENALLKFKRDNKLSEDAVCDVKTQQAINSRVLEKYYDKDAVLEAAYKELNK